jgi:hypothetical protein
LVVASLGLAGVAGADISTERSGSIVVFPKVLATTERDTIIQLTNTSNSLVRAHCFYVNGAVDPVTEEPLWIETDFDIALTKQQPTHWLVRTGRPVNPTDAPCGPMNSACVNAGFDPGLVPPVIFGFEGELKCVEVDDSGAPLAGNHLKGEATLVTLATGDVSKYNGVAVLGSENNGDGTLVLGGGQCVGDGPEQGAVCTSDDDCGGAAPCAPEYNACPDTWILNHLADGAPNPAIEALEPGGATSSVETFLTVVPCSQDYENQFPTTVVIQVRTWNEFENVFSFSFPVTCWRDVDLGELGATFLTFDGQLAGQLPSTFPLGTMYLQTRLRAAGGTPRGMLMVAEEFHTDESGDVAAAAVNLHIEGENAVPDVMIIPDEQLLP